MSANPPTRRDYESNEATLFMNLYKLNQQNYELIKLYLLTACKCVLNQTSDDNVTKTKEEEQELEIRCCKYLASKPLPVHGTFRVVLADILYESQNSEPIVWFDISENDLISFVKFQEIACLKYNFLSTMDDNKLWTHWTHVRFVLTPDTHWLKKYFRKNVPFLFTESIKMRTCEFSASRCNIDGCTNQTKLKNCAGCNMVSYCSVECQRADWLEHKQVCKIPVDTSKWIVPFIEKCATCKVKEDLLLCSNCEMVSYCSVECQKADRKIHKHICKKIN